MSKVSVTMLGVGVGTFGGHGDVANGGVSAFVDSSAQPQNCLQAGLRVWYLT